MRSAVTTISPEESSSTGSSASSFEMATVLPVLWTSSAAMTGKAVDVSNSAQNGENFMGGELSSFVIALVHKDVRKIGQMNFVAFCRNRAIIL